MAWSFDEPEVVFDELVFSASFCSCNVEVASKGAVTARETRSRTMLLGVGSGHGQFAFWPFLLGEHDYGLSHDQKRTKY